MKTWSIRARVLFLALLPSVMILVSLVGYFTYTLIAEVDTLLAQRGVALARQLSPAAEFALFAGDRAALQHLTDAAARERDVASVTIKDKDGIPMAASRSGTAGSAADLVTFTQPVTQTRLPAAEFPEPVASGDTREALGEITVEMSRLAAHVEQRRLLTFALGLGAASMVIAVVLAITIGEGVIRPIQRLARAMAALTRGEHVGPLPQSSGGELGTLDAGFNEMAARLQASARDLEQRVDAATRELSLQRDTAEQATRAKTRLIAVASHDLRQPLHAIQLFTATLQRRVADADLRMVVGDLERAVTIMERLFDSLLDISRLDAGTLPVNPRAFPLQRLFSQLLAEHGDAAAQKHLRLHIRATDVVLMTDELLLHRLLGNLVANAIRYTRKGMVLVRCRRGHGVHEVKIEVRDSGIGIARERQRDIFQEFYQLSTPQQAPAAGLGLGLAIVERLATLLGTKVDVRSAPGRGSVFAIRLPRVAVESLAKPEMASVSPPMHDAPRLPILVVDDDALVLAGNRALLAALGCDVTTANDIASAETAAAQLGSHPLLVMCDFWLRDGQRGVDFLRRLRSLTTAPVGAVLISGDTGPEPRRAASELGIPLLQKPVSPAKLRAVITQFALHLGATHMGDHDEDPSGR